MKCLNTNIYLQLTGPEQNISAKEELKSGQPASAQNVAPSLVTRHTNAAHFCANSIRRNFVILSDHRIIILNLKSVPGAICEF